MHGPTEVVPLAALQSQMSAALLSADAMQQGLPEHWFAGAQSGATGLWVHRNTVLGALSQALRLSFGSVDKLVGEPFFDRMAVEYARAAPPRAPQLGEYGGDFPAFIEDFPGTTSLPYLAELARFDWQLDELGRLCERLRGKSMMLEGGVRLIVAGTLRVHRSRYAIDALRAAILAENTTLIESLTAPAEPSETIYALWRAPEGVKVQSISDVSARFLAAVLAGVGDTAAIESATRADDPEVAAILAREVMSASFVTLEKDHT